MKQSIDKANPEVWNQKNLPSEVEEMEDSPSPAKDILTHLPAAAAGVAKRNRLVLTLSVATIAGLIAFWFYSRND